MSWKTTGCVRRKKVHFGRVSWVEAYVNTNEADFSILLRDCHGRVKVHDSPTLKAAMAWANRWIARVVGAGSIEFA